MEKQFGFNRTKLKVASCLGCWYICSTDNTIILSPKGKIVQEGKHLLDVLDYTYRTCMDIYFKEDNLWVFVTQRVEHWSYSDTRLAPGRDEKARQRSTTVLLRIHSPTFRNVSSSNIKINSTVFGFMVMQNVTLIPCLKCTLHICILWNDYTV